MIWVPDFCPSGNCSVSVARDWTKGSFTRICPHHQQVKDGFKWTDEELLQSLITDSKRKETARAKAKQELLLDKEHPGVWYRVDPDGGFTLGVNQKGALMPEWPTGIQKTRLTTAVMSSLTTDPLATSEVRLA